MSTIFPLHRVSTRSAEGQLQRAIYHPAGAFAKSTALDALGFHLSFQTSPTLRKCWLTPNKSSVYQSIFIYTHTVYTHVCKTFASCLSIRCGVPIGGDCWKGPTTLEYASDPDLCVLHLMLTRSLHGGQHILLTFCSPSNWRATWYLLLYL